MITFKNVEPGESLKVITGDQVAFEDGKNYPVKKIVIMVEAGGVATMMVERFLNSEDPITRSSAKSDDIKDGYGPTTFKNFYTIGAIDGNVELKVAGPHAFYGQMNGLKY